MDDIRVKALELACRLGVSQQGTMQAAREFEAYLRGPSEDELNEPHVQVDSCINCMHPVHGRRCMMIIDPLKLNAHRCDCAWPPDALKDEPTEHGERWCGQDQDHAAHQRRNGGSCLGAKDGVYGTGEAKSIRATRPEAPKDTGVICAGYRSGAGACQAGCSHRQDAHGALGCTLLGCPCERRGGR
jgi:hypothetical protein